MSISLEKCPNQAQDLLKYMKDIRFAAKNLNGWALYDEQFRLRRAGRPGISWGLINSEMWAMYVLMGTKSSQFPHNDVTGNWGDANASHAGFSIKGQIASTGSPVSIATVAVTAANHTRKLLVIAKTQQNESLVENQLS